MTFRTKSRGRQWTVWLCAALVSLVVYVVLSLSLYGIVGWNPFDVRCHRLMLPLMLFFVGVARKTRWDGVRRGEQREMKGGRARSPSAPPSEVGRGVPTAPQPSGSADSLKNGLRRSPSTSNFNFSPSQSPSLRSHSSTSPLSGEELFNRARALTHQPIPDFEFDDEYLDLLGKSAAANYAPALAKLGEYAMRRAAWVEAYYWMTLARRNGMHGLSPTLREIRQNWAKAGFSDETKNVHELFPVKSGSLGRALLHLDSGHEAAVAREFLKENHPEFL